MRYPAILGISQDYLSTMAVEQVVERVDGGWGLSEARMSHCDPRLSFSECGISASMLLVWNSPETITRYHPIASAVCQALIFRNRPTRIFLNFVIAMPGKP